MITLRPATAIDQPRIRELIKEGGINPLGLKWQRFVLAQDETGQIVGCGQLKPHGKRTTELASIAVTRAYRKQGIARQLIEYLMAQHDFPLWLTCDARLVPFYNQFGFERVSNPRQMPPYFRRIARLMKLLGRFVNFGGELAIMVWQE